VAGGIARGDVRLYAFAPPDKKRPVVVLTRDSAIAYLSTVTIAPITSTISGVPSEVVLGEDDGMKTPCAVNLHNAVTISRSVQGNVWHGWAHYAWARFAPLCVSRLAAIPVRDSDRLITRLAQT
jgi:mRNA interferase MazF